MKKELIILDELLYDENLSSEAVCVAAAMNGISHKEDYEYCLSYNAIEYSVFNREGTRREHEVIVKAIEELIKSEYIKITYSITRSEHIYDISNIVEIKDGASYVKITKDEFHKIINMNTTSSNYRLFRFFAILVKTIDNSKSGTKVGFRNQEYLCNVNGITLPTLQRYNKVLEENKLIWLVRNSGIYNQWTDHRGITHISGLSNVYSRYKDRKLCEKFADEKYKTSKEGRNYALVQANYSRQMKQKYNAMVKGKAYSPAEIREIYEFIKEINEKNNDSKYDLSIFNKYIDLN